MNHPTTGGLNDNFGENSSGVQEAKRKIIKLHVESGRRYSIPVASFLLALLGMPLGVYPPRTQRTWGIGLSSLLGLGVFIVYYGVLSIGIAMAEGSKINPYLSLWLPNLIVLLASIFFIRNITLERWHSVAEGLLEWRKK